MSLDSITIRQMTADDADAFSALRRAVVAFNPIGMGLTLEEELTRPMGGFRSQLSYPLPNAAFGAFDHAELVGSAAVAWPSKFPSSGHKAELWGVFVRPDSRGRGIARAVVSHALAHAFSEGVRRVNLLVYEPNPVAVGLYESLGFQRHGSEPEAVYLEGAYRDGLRMSLARREASQ